MLGLIGLIINGLAALRLLGTGLLIVGIVSTVASFWSWGVMMNYRNNPQSAPDWSANVNMISFIAGVILLVISFVI